MNYMNKIGLKFFNFKINGKGRIYEDKNLWIFDINCKNNLIYKYIKGFKFI